MAKKYWYIFDANNLLEMQTVIAHAHEYGGKFEGVLIHHEKTVSFRMSFKRDPVEFLATLKVFKHNYTASKVE